MEDHRYIVWANKATFDVQYTYFEGDLSKMFDLSSDVDPEKLALDLEVYVRDYIEESTADRRIVSFALNRLSEVYWEEIAEYLLSPR
jgi:hypothetical protein